MRTKIQSFPRGAEEMRTRFGVILAVASVVALTVPAIAHHSWPVEYDANKPISVKGVVSKVEWTNPHTHFYVDVIDENGKLTTWNFKMASTVALERGDWTRKTLQVGTTITVTAFGGRAV